MNAYPGVDDIIHYYLFEGKTFDLFQRIVVDIRIENYIEINSSYTCIRKKFLLGCADYGWLPIAESAFSILQFGWEGLRESSEWSNGSSPA